MGKNYYQNWWVLPGFHFPSTVFNYLWSLEDSWVQKTAPHLGIGKYPSSLATQGWLAPPNSQGKTVRSKHHLNGFVTWHELGVEPVLLLGPRFRDGSHGFCKQRACWKELLKGWISMYFRDACRRIYTENICILNNIVYKYIYILYNKYT